MKNSSNRWIYVLVIVLLIGSMTGCASKTEGAEGEIIAEYNGGTVNENEFTVYYGVLRFFDPQLGEIKEQSDETKKQIVERYISEKYLSEQVKEKKSDEAKEMFEYIKTEKLQTLGDEATYNKLLTDLTISEDQLIQYLERLYAIQDYFVEKKYNENKDEFTIATVSHILITIDEGRSEEEAKKRAEEVLAKINNGEDFAELAKEYSDDPGSKDNGGTYENQPVSMWVPEFKDAALTLPLNEVSGLVKTQFGYHIMKVSSREIPEIENIPLQLKNQVMVTEYNLFMQKDLSSIIKEINIPAS